MMAKKTILFICPYPIGHSPSQRFRFEQYFDLLKERGVHISIHPFWDRTTWKILYNRGNIPQKVIGMLSGFWRRLLLLFSVRRADLVFIHREATPIGPPFIEFVVARILKRRIIYDFDDAIWLPDPSVENKSAAFLKWHTKVGAICRWSYKVSCGNEYLCAFAGQFNKQVILNPTTIDTENLHNPALYENNSDSNLITIGWTGTHSTLKYLETLQPVLIDVERKFDGQIKFLVISNRKPELKIQSLQFIPWSKETEIRDLLKIQIGIMPLTENAWANGKCGFKALQYMALRIPTIASSVGVNKKIIESGLNGYLCGTSEEWKYYLEQLITNQKTREAIGQSGRKKIIDHYSVLSNTSNFLSLFE